METEREEDAFFWFFGTFFLACVVGSCKWGVRKQCQLISEATMRDIDLAKLVTKSDEVFALLMHENYINKWRRKQGNNEQSNKDEWPAESVQGGKKVIQGKFTILNTSGTCKYGWWSHAGMEWHGWSALMSCTTWSRRTGLACSRLTYRSEVLPHRREESLKGSSWSGTTSTNPIEDGLRI